MESKLSLKWSWLILIIAGITFSSLIIFSSVNNKSIKLIQNAGSLEQISLESPFRLKIPKINIDAAVENVGLTSDGAVDVPRGPEDVAWFDLGPRPGENGDAVIDGHSGWKDNMPAVFNNLSKLQKGDKIYIEDGKGTTIAFVVREIKSYNPEANVPDVFNSNDEKAHLNLITCSGYWNDAEKTHSDRLVVFADKIF